MGEVIDVKDEGRGKGQSSKDKGLINGGKDEGTRSRGQAAAGRTNAEVRRQNGEGRLSGTMSDVRFEIAGRGERSANQGQRLKDKGLSSGKGQS
jgi:hypothetical protein